MTERDLVVRVVAKRQDPNGVRLEEVVTNSFTTNPSDLELAVVVSSKREVGRAFDGISRSESIRNLNEGPTIGTPVSARGLSRPSHG